MLWDKILMIVLLLALSIAVHELGHWLWFWRNKGMNFNLQWYYVSWREFGFKSVWHCDLTPEEEMNSLLMGIGAGMGVIILFITMSAASFMIYALPIYTAGCKHDILRLIDIIKEKNLIG